MAPDYEEDGGKEQTEQCKSAKDLLKEVTDELATFEAKKLSELKADLDAFVKKQDGLVIEYKSKYPVLRKLWCDRQQDVERLCAHIKCEFPPKDEKWKKIIEVCICTPLHDLCCLEQQIAARKKCCNGPLQRARDAAQVAFDAAKKRLDWTTGLAAKIDAALAENLKLVGDIEKVPPTERPVSLYLYFKLRRSHVHLAPFDATAECKKVCPEFDPITLCGDVYKVPCKDDDGGCTPKDDDKDDTKDEKKADGCSQMAEPDGPSLISPDDYRNALDCAWQAYRKAKDALGDAEAKYKAAPDDLDSLSKKLADNTKGLDDAIKKCLKDVKSAADDCCREKEKEAEPKKSGC